MQVESLKDFKFTSAPVCQVSPHTNKIVSHKQKQAFNGWIIEEEQQLFGFLEVMQVAVSVCSECSGLC